jgi:FkbM family methyltransferase
MKDVIVESEPGILMWSHGNDLLELERARQAGAGWDPANLRKDFSPATVIDVGVENGTKPLYDAFPDAFHVLIEPLQEFEAKLRQRLTKMAGELLLTAVGDTAGEAVINVNPDELWGSSILSDAFQPSKPEQRTVPITTLDALLEERRWSGPFGLKIDVEGYEAHVIEGARNLLRDTQFVLAEVGAQKRFEDSYTFAEFVALMDAHGFGLCDLVDGTKDARHGRLLFLDALFQPYRI